MFFKSKTFSSVFSCQNCMVYRFKMDKFEKREPVRTYEIKSTKGRQKMEENFLRAVEESNAKVVDICITKGVNPNIFNDEDMTALHIAAAKGDVNVGQQLFKAQKLNLNARTLVGMTPLMFACIYRQRNFAKALLNRGADPNPINDKGQTALHMACITSSMGITYDLTSAGARVNVLDVFDNTPLSIAVTEYPSESIVRHLLKKGANATSTKQFPLLLECVLNCNSQKRLRVLQILLSYDIDINCLHPISKRNCLHYTGITGYVPAAELLLENGANMHHIDRSNRSPLQLAMDHENKEIVRLFRFWDDRKKVYFSDTEDIIIDLRGLYG